MFEKICSYWHRNEDHQVLDTALERLERGEQVSNVALSRLVTIEQRQGHISSFRSRLAKIDLIAMLTGSQRRLRTEAGNSLHQKAYQITHNLSRDLLRENAANFLFLINRPLGFDRNIRVLSELWETDAKLRFCNGELVFHSGESVAELRRELEMTPEQRVSLNAFGVRRASERVLSPSFHLNSHDGKYYAAIMTDCKSASLSLAGNHTWMRLYAANGDVYSIGKWPKDLKYCQVLGQFAPDIQVDDSYEFLMRGGHCRSDTAEEKRIEVTQEEFASLTADIQADLDQPDRAGDFAIVDQNCGDYCLQKLQNAGVAEIDPLQGRVYYLRFAFPGFVNRLLDQVIRGAEAIHGRAARMLMRRILAVVSPIFNFPALFVGALAYNSGHSDSRPTLSRYKDAFRPLYAAHPTAVRRYARSLPRLSRGSQELLGL